MRFGAILLAAALAVALFVFWSLNPGHGLYALIVLVVGAVALALFGGPESLARTITVSPDDIRISRFHRVATVVERSELTDARAEVETGRRNRPRTVLVLEPLDPEIFYTRHRELRAVRHGDAALVPAGGAAIAEELTEALAGG